MNLLRGTNVTRRVSTLLVKNNHFYYNNNNKLLHNNANVIEETKKVAPLVDVQGEKISYEKLLKNKKIVLIGIPGAFTPVCSTKHIPSFLYNADKIKSYGVDDIICVSVNDHFVMSAWANIMHVDDKIKMYADPAGEFTKSIKMETDLTSTLGGLRSKRYSAIIENGVVTSHNIEPTLATSDETDAINILTKLADSKK